VSVRRPHEGLLSELSHEADRGETEERESGMVAVFPVTGETPASVEPCDAPLDDPAFGFDDEGLWSGFMHRTTHEISRANSG